MRPIQAGAGLGFGAGIVTWFVAISVVGDLMVSYGALAVQASTGLFAVVVLLIVMNWFFHGVYWSGWINMQTRAKRSLIEEAGQFGQELPPRPPRACGTGLRISLPRVCRSRPLPPKLLYRDGSHRCLLRRAGRLGADCSRGLPHFPRPPSPPLQADARPTGVLLTGVLFVMVGEEVNEMQLAGWIGTTNIPGLQGIPAWAGLWFSVFPNVQTFVGQALALLLVAGTYFLARHRMWKLIHRQVPDVGAGLTTRSKDDARIPPDGKPLASA